MVGWEYLIVSDFKGINTHRFTYSLGNVNLFFSDVKLHPTKLDYEFRGLMGLLRDVGRDGWEMCGVNQLDNEDFAETRYFFKRPIKPND